MLTAKKKKEQDIIMHANGHNALLIQAYSKHYRYTKRQKLLLWYVVLYVQHFIALYSIVQNGVAVCSGGNNITLCVLKESI